MVKISCIEKKKRQNLKGDYVFPQKTSCYEVSPGRPKQSPLHLPCLKFKSKHCMKVALIMSENKQLEGILSKTDLVLFRYQDKSRKLWNNWSKASRAVRAGVLAFGTGGEAVGARPGQPEEEKAWEHPQLPHDPGNGSRRRTQALCVWEEKRQWAEVNTGEVQTGCTENLPPRGHSGCPKRMRCLHPWRCSSPGLTQSCPCCVQEAGQETPEASPPALSSCQLQEAHCRDTLVRGYIH